MADLLIELLSEEIPARMQTRAAADLGRLLSERLTAAGLAHDEPQTFVTPRRLAVAVRGLPRKQPDVNEERRGPRVDAPDKAVQGFLKANGLKTVKQAEVRTLAKGEFYFAVRKIEGQETAAVLPGAILDAVRALGWPKSMRWADGQFRWVRPLHSILAVFGGQGLPGALPLNGEVALPFGNRTAGHRFLAPRPFRVRGIADYEAKLARAYVILDPEERKADILRQAKRRVARAKLRLRDDPVLLEEVTGMVEWPVVLMGRIDPQFMDLPPEVLTTTMRSHQKYLALTDAKGRLADRFLLVANMETADKGKAIVAGNERVLRARLADARFFWDQDRGRSLASRAPRLKEIVFHEKLGSLDDKVDRMQALAVEVADYVPGADKDRARSAARLAKADLVTGMVGEFPELQGVMGRYYALHDGEHKDVARAIAEHYSPLGPGDACPSAPTSVAVALADKIDTLVGLFAIGERPTGSKDPYALRRAALGVIRLVIENKLRLRLFEAFAAANDLYPPNIRASLQMGESDLGVVSHNLLNFLLERLKVDLRRKGARHDLVSAVFAVRLPGGGPEQDLVRLLEKVDALSRFLTTEDGANLLVAYRRAANIVRIEEKRDSKHYDGAELDPNLLHEPDEQELCLWLDDVRQRCEMVLKEERFHDAMAILSGLRAPVDKFFDEVTVNVDERDLRANRLRLLARIRMTLDRVADFSRIEG